MRYKPYQILYIGIFLLLFFISDIIFNKIYPVPTKKEMSHDLENKYKKTSICLIIVEEHAHYQGVVESSCSVSDMMIIGPYPKIF